MRRRWRRCFFFFFLVVDADRVGTWPWLDRKRMKGIREALERFRHMYDTGSIASPTWNCRTPLLVPRHCQFGHSKTKLLTTNEGNLQQAIAPRSIVRDHRHLGITLKTSGPRTCNLLSAWLPNALAFSASYSGVIGLASDDVRKLSNAWQRGKLVLNKGSAPYKSMLGEKSLTRRSSLFLRREVRTVLSTPSLLSASHFKR